MAHEPFIYRNQQDAKQAMHEAFATAERITGELENQIHKRWSEEEIVRTSTMANTYYTRAMSIAALIQAEAVRVITPTDIKPTAGDVESLDETLLGPR